VGVIKKEILFTGDVLNTTSRIQGSCNQYSVDILFSEELLQQLKIDSQYSIKEIGETHLRGRNARIKLFTIGET